MMEKGGYFVSEKENNNSRNVFKTASGEANKLVHQTVDSAGNVVKTFSGSDGLITKTYDTSGNVIKSVSDTGNKFVGKTVDTSSKFVKGAASKFTRHGKKGE